MFVLAHKNHTPLYTYKSSPANEAPCLPLSQLPRGYHNYHVVITTTTWFSQCPRGSHNVHVVLTMSTWLSQLPRGYHNVHVVITTTTWFSQCPRGYHNYHVVLTMSTWLSQLSYTILFHLHVSPPFQYNISTSNFL